MVAIVCTKFVDIILYVVGIILIQSTSCVFNIKLGELNFYGSLRDKTNPVSVGEAL